MTAAHKGKAPPEFQLDPDQAHIIDTVRIAEEFGVSPSEVRSWSLFDVNEILQVYEADLKLAKLKGHHR